MSIIMGLLLSPAACKVHLVSAGGYCGAIEAFWKECMIPRDEGKKIPNSVFQQRIIGATRT
jgi:hypothetical protein